MTFANLIAACIGYGEFFIFCAAFAPLVWDIVK